jgi:hypothetical protein
MLMRLIRRSRNFLRIIRCQFKYFKELIQPC